MKVIGVLHDEELAVWHALGDALTAFREHYEVADGAPLLLLVRSNLDIELAEGLAESTPTMTFGVEGVEPTEIEGFWLRAAPNLEECYRIGMSVGRL